ncbi:hypothetical protein TREMEDRAFT_67430 [Tremella mesenterica DSM 1558]|uniref:uncharacterized protein n=1 Tax=Tremella mesenterica (strain ATCC 24925 / CBS 8224 / DSM 1558 / NBRC 9311 / NRRL Y-6157 / RJB 2259-6 / UBC 559-6) TaxID=578456 RepID=UPI0003F48E19|nr:uncharacterized protein TREMEDRAFT_67430 [Tremella mesenterica DSM 1558]EIW73576.1 hypothetical protein TREMEDRAFT_67430 [Tremella mesenterica DSM 1558]
MTKKALIKYRSLRSNLVHLPLSLFAQLAQQQIRPQSLLIHLSPLTPSSSRTQAAYVGWSGLAAASSLNIPRKGDGEVLETVEVDPEVAMQYGWMEGIVVEIGIIHDPTRANSISVTPLTPDDWEILEQHTSFLENNLLSQLRAVQKNQVINAWVAGRTKIQLRVDGTDPGVKQGAVLVHPDTEVIVAPRPRKAIAAAVEEPRVVDTTNKEARPNKKARERNVRLRLIPPTVAAAWGQFQLSEAQSTEVGSFAVALCSPNTLRRLRRRLEYDDKRPPVFRLLKHGSKNVENEVTAVERDGDGHADGNIEEDGQNLDVILVAWDEMPDGALVVTGEGLLQWQTWGSVKVSSIAKQRSRRKSGRSQGVLDMLPPYIHMTSLPGLEATLGVAVGALTRAFILARPCPLLVTGTKGMGKTTLVMAITRRLEGDREILAETHYVDVRSIQADGRLSAIKDQMRSWVEEAKKRRPCLLVLDNLDSLLTPETELNSSNTPIILAEHFCRLVSPGHLPEGIGVLVTAASTKSLHPALNASHVFGEILKIPALTKEVRREVSLLIREYFRANSKIFSAAIEKQLCSTTSELPDLNIHPKAWGISHIGLDLITLTSMTEGYSTSDLVDLVSAATQQAMIRLHHSPEETFDLTMEDFTQAQESFTPISLRGITFQHSTTVWSDIGGLRLPKRILRETLEWPIKYAQIFASCPLRLRSGLLLYGYPGCGKTLLASAVAKECGLNFISVKGPEILNKYIGASEKAVRDLFERASGAKPCVLFFDEFDSIAPKRGHDSTGVTDRIVNQLLTEMDGAQGLEGVYVLAATSRPDLIDPALLRPGRLDKSVLCDMPPFEGRLEILQTVSRKIILDHSVDLEHIAHETVGYSGADLQAVIYNAHLEVMETILSNVTPRPTFQPRPIERTLQPLIQQIHLLRALESTRPSVSLTERRRLETIYKAFVSDRESRMQTGDLGRETGTRASLM